MTMTRGAIAISRADSAQADLVDEVGQVKRSGRSQIGAGTSEIRRWLIGRELFAETA